MKKHAPIISLPYLLVVDGGVHEDVKRVKDRNIEQAESAFLGGDILDVPDGRLEGAEQGKHRREAVRQLNLGVSSQDIVGAADAFVLETDNEAKDAGLGRSGIEDEAVAEIDGERGRLAHAVMVAGPRDPLVLELALLVEEAGQTTAIRALASKSFT